MTPNPPPDKDVEHLQWIYDRMENVHGENPRFDYMLRFKEILSRLTTRKSVNVEVVDCPECLGRGCHTYHAGATPCRGCYPNNGKILRERVHLTARLAEPDMVLVPREPTNAMIDAGIAQQGARLNGEEYGHEQIYKAMLSAAPVLKGDKL